MAKKKTDASQNTGADNGVTSSYKNDTGSGKNTGRSGAGNGNKALPAPKRAKTPGDPDSFSAQIVSVIFWVLAFLLSVFFHVTDSANITWHPGTTRQQNIFLYHLTGTYSLMSAN